MGIVTVAALAALGYTVLLGGTGLGEQNSALRIVNAAIAAFFIVAYFWRAPVRADRIDRGILIALLLFAGAAVLSQFPRQSFDAILGALTATAGLFVLRGELINAPARIAFIRLLMGLSIAMTFLTAVTWLPLTAEWWSLAGRSVIPPLDLNFSTQPWGHRHDLALLVVLLYPSLWVGSRSPLRTVVALVFGVLVGLIVLLDGSRNLWLAMLVSTIVIAAPATLRWLRGSRRARLILSVGLLLGGLALLATGAAVAFLDRLTNLQSFGARSEMWAPLTGFFVEHPVAGSGPGSFPWVLRLTDYFETNSWDPRHPDSALFQVLAEGGLLGLAALVTVVSTVAVPVLRGPSAAARWALIVFVVACVGANPTDFAFLVAVAVAWTAYAAPREEPGAPDRTSRRSVRIGYAIGLSIVAVAFAMTAVGAIYYDAARRAVATGDLPTARRALDVAVFLDPGMALYPRQRGTLDYLDGNVRAGIQDLELATRINPTDDLAWRVLALAYDAAGEHGAAAAALDLALARQRSDPANLFLRAQWLTRDGHTQEAVDTLAEIIQAWPATVGAPGWAAVLPASVTTSDVVDRAIERWRGNLPSVEQFSGQGLWLAVIGDRLDLESAAVAASEAAGSDRAQSEAVLATLRCDAASDAELDQLSESSRRGQWYWQMRLRMSAWREPYDPAVFRLLKIMWGRDIPASAADETMSPLNEAGFSADVWGYRRPSIEWQTPGDELPLPQAGDVRWLLDPFAAVREAGLEERLPGCR